MTSILKNVYIDDIVNKYKNTYHRTIKMKSADVNSISCKNVRIMAIM